MSIRVKCALSETHYVICGFDRVPVVGEYVKLPLRVDEKDGEQDYCVVRVVHRPDDYPQTKIDLERVWDRYFRAPTHEIMPKPL